MLAAGLGQISQPARTGAVVWLWLNEEYMLGTSFRSVNDSCHLQRNKFKFRLWLTGWE